MLHVFKRNDALSFVALVLLAMVLKVHLLMYPPAWSSLQGFMKATLFNFPGIEAFYQSNPIAWILLSALIQTMFAVYLNFTVIRQKLFQQKTLVPAAVFLIYSAMVPACNILSVAYIYGMLIFIAFSLSMDLYQMQDARSRVYNIGIFAALGTLFYFPSVLFFLLFLVIILILRSANLKDMVAFVLGYLTPVYFAFGIRFLLLKKNTHFYFYKHLQLPLQVSTFLYFGVITLVSILLLVYAAYLNNHAGYRIPIGVKKKWNTVFWYFFMAALAGVFAPEFPAYTWIVAIIPFSIILSQCFLNNLEKYNTFTFYFFLLAVFGIQWFLNS